MPETVGEFVAVVSECDAAQHSFALHDPAVRALDVVPEPLDPVRKALCGLDIIIGRQPETVLVEPRPPLGVRITPRSDEIIGGNDEVHRQTVAPDSGSPHRIVLADAGVEYGMDRVMLSTTLYSGFAIGR